MSSTSSPSSSFSNLVPNQPGLFPTVNLTSLTVSSKSRKNSNGALQSVTNNTCYSCFGNSMQSMKYLCCLFLGIIVAIRVSATLFTSTYVRTILQDLMVNQEFISVTPQQLMTEKYRTRGQAEIRQSDVTIVGVARDIADQLPRLLIQIESLAKEFQFSQAIFVEGDSSDSTLQDLEIWAAKSPYNRTIVTISSFNDMEDVEGFKGLPLPREGRLAKARNKALDELRNLPVQTKYMIVLDMDIIGWNPYGIEDSFGRVDDWDVVCANGILLQGIYRDTYAFRKEGIDTNHHKCGDDHADYNISFTERFQNRALHTKSKKEAKRLMDINRHLESNFIPKLVQVDSCFGGLAIYKTDSISGCSYEYRSRIPPYMLDCEHVYFHECLRENHNARIVSNPHMKLWYGHTNLRKIDLKKVIKSIVPGNSATASSVQTSK